MSNAAFSDTEAIHAVNDFNQKVITKTENGTTVGVQILQFDKIEFAENDESMVGLARCEAQIRKCQKSFADAVMYFNSFVYLYLFVFFFFAFDLELIFLFCFVSNICRMFFVMLLNNKINFLNTNSNSKNTAENIFYSTQVANVTKAAENAVAATAKKEDKMKEEKGKGDDEKCDD